LSNLIVDVALLACPNPDRVPSRDFNRIFIEFITRLTDLTIFRGTCKSVRFWSDERLAGTLAENDCYPFRHVLVQAFQHLANPSEFQIEDISAVAIALIEKSQKFEEEGNIKDVVVSGCSLENDPVIGRIDAFRDYLCRVLALALPILGDGRTFAPNTYIASCGKPSDHADIRARYTVSLVEARDGSYTECLLRNDLNVGHYRGVGQLSQEADLASWWAAGTEQALTFGSEFVSSARALGFMHDAKKIDKLLRVCGDLVLGRDSRSGHALRTGRGANEPQIARGKWRGWRHDIDDEFHLHYWKTGSRVELANVVVHGDFGISA
jgi:hypothetical protein